MPKLRRAGSREAFHLDGAGAYFTGHAWLAFYGPNKSVSGVIVSGEIGEAELGDLLVTWERRLLDAPHPSIIDVRRLTRIDPLAFGGLVDFMTRNRAKLEACASRTALVHALDPAGAVLAGILTIFDFGFPVRTFSTIAGAMAWTSIEDSAAMAVEVERIAEEAIGSPPLLGRLGQFLQANPIARLEEAASALSLSRRSLQRKLSELETSYAKELRTARITQAQRLLLDTNASITRIALEVGCGSVQCLSTLFRRSTGETPTAWRARQREARVA